MSCRCPSYKLPYRAWRLPVLQAALATLPFAGLQVLCAWWSSWLESTLDENREIRGLPFTSYSSIPCPNTHDGSDPQLVDVAAGPVSDDPAAAMLAEDLSAVTEIPGIGNGCAPSVCPVQTSVGIQSYSCRFEHLLFQLLFQLFKQMLLTTCWCLVERSTAALWEQSDIVSHLQLLFQTVTHSNRVFYSIQGRHMP